MESVIIKFVERNEIYELKDATVDINCYGNRVLPALRLYGHVVRAFNDHAVSEYSGTKPISVSKAKLILNSIYGVSSVNSMGIKDVIFNDPAIIVLWKDGTKTVVKCQENDTFSKETGLAMAICKKFFGNKSNYNDVFKQWIKED